MLRAHQSILTSEVLIFMKGRHEDFYGYLGLTCYENHINVEQPWLVMNDGLWNGGLKPLRCIIKESSGRKVALYPIKPIALVYSVTVSWPVP